MPPERIKWLAKFQLGAIEWAQWTKTRCICYLVYVANGFRYQSTFALDAQVGQNPGGTGLASTCVGGFDLPVPALDLGIMALGIGDEFVKRPVLFGRRGFG